MPLTAAFSFRLKDQILENTACVGLYDGERPTLTAATTALFLLLAFSRCRNISCAGNGVWIGLGGGIGHG